jgi:hypothetical protein
MVKKINSLNILNQKNIWFKIMEYFINSEKEKIKN